MLSLISRFDYLLCLSNSCDGSIGLLMGMIRTAHKGAGLDVAKTHLLAFGLQSSKFFEGNIALNGQVVKRWAEILPNGQDVDLVFSHIMHHFDNFIPRLAKAQHETRFCRGGRIHLFSPLQYL